MRNICFKILPINTKMSMIIYIASQLLIVNVRTKEKTKRQANTMASRITNPTQSCIMLLLARLINRQVEVSRSAQTISILRSVWSASKCSHKESGIHDAIDHSFVCLEENEHSRGDGCVLWGRISSLTDQGFGCDRCAVEPV